jgi:hypothetical protein
VFPKCEVDKYEGGGLERCKNVARLEVYSKARRRKTGELVSGIGKDRSKITKAALEGALGSGPRPCCASSQVNYILVVGGCDACVSMNRSLNAVEPGNFSGCDEAWCTGLSVPRTGSDMDPGN